MVSMKSQSAMEYLMTYGWAILIIAVVLGAIYSLGLFNGASLSPRASPGACQVYRPNGPQTTTYINLAGICTNELPQYVGYFNGNGYISVPPALPFSQLNKLTITMWINPASGFNNNRIMWNDCGGSSPGYYIQISSGKWFTQLFTNTYQSILQPSIPLPASGTWTFLATSYDGNTQTLFINSLNITNGAATNSIVSTCPLEIGLLQGGGYSNFNGYMADIQIYNTSLDTNSIKTLYTEGIGGAPITLQNLVGWWPLNGNANDYSGNLNSGQPSSMLYTNQWLAGYNTP